MGTVPNSLTAVSPAVVRADPAALRHSANRLDALLPLFKGVRKSGSGFVAYCPGHDDRHRSLSITVRTGRVLLHCFAGCSIDAICGALGLAIADLFTASCDNANTRFRDADRKAYARKLWEASKPARNTVVAEYLANRGIVMPIPRALRFTTVNCPDFPRGMLWPVMIGGIQDVNGKFVGVQLTTLCADGSDKAPVETPRKIHGPFAGSAVRLTTRSDSRLAVGEGIETMLSVQQATEIPCWAALTASNLARLELPEGYSEVTICADFDEAGEAAAQTLARRLISQRRQVRVTHPARR